MKWYQELGYEENPFSVNPKKNLDKLYMMDNIVEETAYRIKAGSVFVIEGKKGTGKTSVLMTAVRKFGGRKKVVYIDSERLDKELNITHVLQERYGFVGRILNKKPKDMIVLMDNVHELSNKNTERLKYYFDQNYIRSIIFTTTDYNDVKFSDSLRDRIGTRIAKTPEITDGDAVDIIKARIGDDDILNEELIRKIFQYSDNSPGIMLENCTKVAKKALEKGRFRVQMIDLKELRKNE